MKLNYILSLFIGLALATLNGHASINNKDKRFHPRNSNGVFNTGTVEIDDLSRFNQVIALSDVHGMFGSLIQLLGAQHLIDGQHHWIGGPSLLVIVGDSIDKGPQSLPVLDLWVALQSEIAKAGGQLVFLLGNHEAELLANPKNDSKATELYQELNAAHLTIQDLLDSSQPRGFLLRSAPVAALIGHWLFCHAGYLPPNLTWGQLTSASSQILSQNNYADPLLSDPNSILENKSWWNDQSERTALLQRLSSNGISGVVFGHQPKAFGMIGRVGSVEGGHIYKLDSGMPPEAGGHSGQLVIFDRPAQLMQASPLHALAAQANGARTEIHPETSSIVAPSDIHAESPVLPIETRLRHHHRPKNGE